MLYSTHIYADNDRVRALAIKIGARTVEAHDALRFSADVVRLARYWRSKLELESRAREDYDPKFQTFILTDKGDWAPVDHLLWRTAAGEEVRIDFTAWRIYLHDRQRPMQYTTNRYKALRLFASAVRRLALK